MAAHQETADDYGRVLAALNARWRVAVCHDGMQYLLQRRGKGNSTFPWASQSFCTDRKSLERCIREKVIAGGFSVGGEASTLSGYYLTGQALLRLPTPSHRLPARKRTPDHAFAASHDRAAKPRACQSSRVPAISTQQVAQRVHAGA